MASMLGNYDLERLLDAIRWQESRGNANAVSPKGARTAYGIMPATARDPGYGVPGTDINNLVSDPKAAREFSRRYLQAMYDRTGDVGAALAAYNGGLGRGLAYKKGGKLPAETANYVPSVFDHYKTNVGVDNRPVNEGGILNALNPIGTAHAAEATPPMQAALNGNPPEAVADPFGYQRGQVNRAAKGDMLPMQAAMQPTDIRPPGLTAPQAPQEASMAGKGSPFGTKDYWKRAILGAGAGLSSIDNPQGAAIALGMLRDMNGEWDLISGKYGAYRYNKRTGEFQRLSDGAAGGPNSEYWDRNIAKKAVERLDDNQSAVGDINTRIQKLNELESYVDNPGVYQGFAGGAVAALKNAARTFGFDDSAYGTDETQAFRALSNQFALSIRNPKAGEGLPGNLSDKDLAFLKQSTPSLDNTPEGNKKIIHFMRKIEKKNKLMKEEEARYIKETHTIEGLAEHMNEFRNKIDMFTDEADKTKESGNSYIEYDPANW